MSVYAAGAKPTAPPSEFAAAVERGLAGCIAPSIGICPGCSTCADTWTDGDLAALAEGVECGEIESESSFSWGGCVVCGSTLGGDREPLHWIDDAGEICHEFGACVDCIIYMANGDEPSDWGKS